MIDFFEKETSPLTDYEKETLLPVMTKCLSYHIGKKAAITNRQMCAKMEEHGYNMNETRTRKIINHIRNNALVQCLMATNKGYYVTEDPQEMKDYICSLKGRESAIRAVREALEKQLKDLTERTSTKDDLDGRMVS